MAFGKERLAAWSWGHGPTVLLVHGWNGSAAQLSGFVMPLVAAGFRVVAFDQPGHGLSSGRTASLPLLRDAVQAVARHAGDVDAIIGHSLGGMAAALAVCGGLPVRRLVLAASPVEVRYFPAEFARRLCLPARCAEGLRRRIEKRIGMSVDAFDLRRSGAATQVPLLVVHDRGDREVPVSHGAALAAAWSGASYVELDGLGHVRLLADPAVIARVVEFVTGSGADGWFEPRDESMELAPFGSSAPRFPDPATPTTSEPGVVRRMMAMLG